MYSSEIEENKSKNNLKPLLDMIGSGESDNVGGYSAMFPSESYPEMLDMSINELIEFQKENLKMVENQLLLEDIKCYIQKIMQLQLNFH